MRFSSSSKLFITYAICLSFTVIIFQNLFYQIDFTKNSQSHYIIDGFYYYKVALTYSYSNIMDIIYNPINVSSFGVLLVNKIYSILFPFAYFPVINVSVLFFVLSSLYNIKSSLFLSLVVMLISPYLGVVSKEFIILLGLLCLFSRANFFIRFLGLVLLVLGRPEAAFLFIFSTIFYYVFWSKKVFLQISFIVICTSIYIFVLREFVYETSLLFQSPNQSSDYSCEIPVFRTCLTSSHLMEFTFFQRSFAIFLLPVKWVLDVFNNQSIFSYLYFFTSFYLTFFLLFTNHVKNLFIRSPILVIFCFLNIIVYLSILFLAPSRPVFFNFYILMLFAVLQPRLKLF